MKLGPAAVRDPVGGSIRTAGSSRAPLAPPPDPEFPFPVKSAPDPGVNLVRKDDGAMSLISRLFEAVRSCRRRRGGPKTAQRASVAMEPLDHRQLLSVNFTGNVATDFPATQNPGVVVLADNANVIHPVISPDIAGIVKVSGFDISGVRVTYTPADDTLNIGIEQPLSQQPSHPGPVIAGDADNNGDDGTVDPAVTAIKGSGF